MTEHDDAAGGRSAVRLVRDIAAGRVTALEVTEFCLDRIARDEERVHAWAHLDPEHARAQARTLDERRSAGMAVGPLHGLPVGVKDIIDTADFPTEHGSPLCAGRRPTRDATVVSRLRAAGAVILGKTVTTEFAYFTPGKTRNPHDPQRTPGGSSSGSAAAVAAGMVPLAVGSQTNGSVIRPASFCGVYGYKPSFGLIPRTGVLAIAPTLDHVGVFARTIEDLALLAQAMMGFDPDDPATAPVPVPSLVAMANAALPVTPRLAFVKGPAWEQAEPSTVAAFKELAEALGDQLIEVKLPETFAEALTAHRTIYAAEVAFQLEPFAARGWMALSEQLRAFIEEGRRVTAPDYQRALRTRHRLQRDLDELFRGFDALVTPATPGEAPQGLGSTGNPAFCTSWSLTGSPAVNLPILKGPHGLPLGCQLVGPIGDDARLLRTAHWLVSTVG